MSDIEKVDPPHHAHRNRLGNPAPLWVFFDAQKVFPNLLMS